MSLLSRLFIRNAPSADRIYNTALRYAADITAFAAGTVSCKLARKYPSPIASQLAHYDAVLKDAVDSAHKFVYGLLGQPDARRATIKKRSRAAIV